MANLSWTMICGTSSLYGASVISNRNLRKLALLTIYTTGVCSYTNRLVLYIKMLIVTALALASMPERV